MLGKILGKHDLFRLTWKEGWAYWNEGRIRALVAAFLWRAGYLVPKLWAMISWGFMDSSQECCGILAKNLPHCIDRVIALMVNFSKWPSISRELPGKRSLGTTVGSSFKTVSLTWWLVSDSILTWSKFKECNFEIKSDKQLFFLWFSCCHWQVFHSSVAVLDDGYNNCNAAVQGPEISNVF